MKYKYGVIVYSKNEYKKYGHSYRPTVLQIMKYDEKKNKYICISTDEYCLTDDAASLEFISEDDIELYENFDKEYAIEMKAIYNDLFPEDLNLYCYNLYDCNDGDCILYRKAFLRKRIPRIR